MITCTLVLALTVIGGAVAGESAENQLETLRLTQAAQREEFGIEGPHSAFKFRFSDLVHLASLAASSVLDVPHTLS